MQEPEFLLVKLGQLAGVYQTEWSWSPLFADFNNDGHRDLFITNGFPKDITDKDFANYRAEVGNIAGPELLVDSIPVIKISNYALRIMEILRFQIARKPGVLISLRFQMELHLSTLIMMATWTML